MRLADVVRRMIAARRRDQDHRDVFRRFYATLQRLACEREAARTNPSRLA